MIAYEFASASRIVHLDKAEQAPADSYMGWSIGHWEGDTLVVDVTGFNDKTWFDRAGDFHSDALHVVERYTPASRRYPALRSHHRGPQGVHAAVEDQFSALSPPG